MDNKYVKAKYREWLLRQVLLEGWTTAKCASVLKRDPRQVMADFQRFCNEVKRKTKG